MLVVLELQLQIVAVDAACRVDLVNRDLVRRS